MRTLRFSLLVSLVSLLIFPCNSPAEDGWKQADLGGIRIAYQDLGPRDAPALVLIHGWSCDSTFWRMQVPAFSERYRLLVPDLPGFGRSAKPQEIHYSMAFFAKAVKAVVDDARAQKPALVGHSMGFAVVRQYLIDYPGGVRGVCSVDGALFTVPEQPEARSQWNKEMEAFREGFSSPNRAARVNAFIEDTFYQKTAQALRPTIKKTMAAADAYAANSALYEMCRPEQWKPRHFAVPALAVYAVHPDYPMDNEADLRKVFPGSLTFIEWDDLGHYIMLEAPDRFNKALADFLDTLPE